MDRLENKVGGVRLSAKDVGGSQEYSYLLEVMREVYDRKTDIETYEHELRINRPKRGLETKPWIDRLALVHRAKSIATSIGGVLSYNPKDEGIYISNIVEKLYTEHGQGD